VGHTTVASADVLVAVWDGRPAAGRGGTPEIIAHALLLGRPVVWIDAARARLPRLIAAPTASGSRELSLDQLAQRARPLTRRRLAQIGARLTAATDFAERDARARP